MIKSLGNVDNAVNWHRPRTFVAVVEELRQHQFQPGVGVPFPADRHITRWKACKILSADERILASQTGDANQWLLSAHFRRADRYPFAEEIEGCQELSVDFFCLVTGSMFLMNME